MTAATKRKSSLTLDSAALDAARTLEINVSAVAEARRQNWLDENAAAFAAQSDWHDRNGHPLADILMTGV
jgi:antitoxin CcdA